MLERCGYEFDSSFTAPDVMTNFPYALMLDRGFKDETTIYEFPFAIEDEASPLNQRVAQGSRHHRGQCGKRSANGDSGASQRPREQSAGRQAISTALQGRSQASFQPEPRFYSKIAGHAPARAQVLGVWEKEDGRKKAYGLPRSQVSALCVASPIVIVDGCPPKGSDLGRQGGERLAGFVRRLPGQTDNNLLKNER